MNDFFTYLVANLPIGVDFTIRIRNDNYGPVIEIDLIDKRLPPKKKSTNMMTSVLFANIDPKHTQIFIDEILQEFK